MQGYIRGTKRCNPYIYICIYVDIEITGKKRKEKKLCKRERKICEPERITRMYCTYNTSSGQRK